MDDWQCEDCDHVWGEREGASPLDCPNCGSEDIDVVDDSLTDCA